MGLLGGGIIDGFGKLNQILLAGRLKFHLKRPIVHHNIHEKLSFMLQASVLVLTDSSYL